MQGRLWDMTERFNEGQKGKKNDGKVLTISNVPKHIGNLSNEELDIQFNEIKTGTRKDGASFIE